MAAISTIQNNNTTVVFSCSPSNTNFEKTIKSLKAEQIIDLSKQVLYAIRRESWTDFEEVFSTHVLPLIATQIEKAFSTPSDFLANGIQFKLFAEDESGILQSFEDIEFYKGDNITGEDKYRAKLDDVSYSLTLTLGQESSKDNLDFLIQPYAYGNKATYSYGKTIPLGS